MEAVHIVNDNVSKSRHRHSVAARIMPDGSVIPVNKPKVLSGRYQRPAGRGRDGYSWDEIRGVWTPSEDQRFVTSTKDNLSSPNEVLKKKTCNIPLMDDHCIVSIIYNTQVSTSGSGGRAQTTSQSVVNLTSNRQLTPADNQHLTPRIMKTALAPMKAAALALVDKESLNCAICGHNNAQYITSSLIVSQGSNGNNHAVLHVSERLICSCNELKCISEAKKTRNQEKAQGSGFSVALRGALEPISNVFSVVRRKPNMCQPTSSLVIGNKVLFDNEQPPTKKLRFDSIKV